MQLPSFLYYNAHSSTCSRRVRLYGVNLLPYDFLYYRPVVLQAIAPLVASRL